LNHENIGDRVGLLVPQYGPFLAGARSPDPANDAFRTVIETCTAALPQTEREQRLAAWQRPPPLLLPPVKNLLNLHVTWRWPPRPSWYSTSSWAEAQWLFGRKENETCRFPPRKGL
jgi:hypothetical protein